jgi:hypothetical protein
MKLLCQNKKFKISEISFKRIKFGNIFENRTFEINTIEMKTLKLFGFLFFFSAFFCVQAQEVTDYDLQNFARAYRESVLLNNEAQKEMAKEIQKADLTLEVYHAIAESKHPEATLDPELPQKDFDNYEKVHPKIMEIQNELEASILKVYAKNDLNKQKYKAIAERVKQDYILQAKMEKLLAGMR